MKKFKFQLDTESINRENEIHSNNFPIKVKNLAEHCINFITGTHNADNCSDRKYNRELHDQNIVQSPIDTRPAQEIDINSQKIIAQIFQFRELEFKAHREKFLL